MTDMELITRAFEAREYAYTPYSHFKVGAALLTVDGRVYTGCNIENASYSPSNCAERTAFFKAVSEGVRSFDRIAVVGGPEGMRREDGKICAPCGVCRQVMREFCDPEKFRILLSPDGETCVEYLLSELLPESFGPENLRK